MADKGFKRKLTAIFSADVAGYSRLMGEDEEATVETITAYREVLSTLIKQHNGKVVDSPGYNLLAEFVSVVDAVQCAVAVQKEINSRNDELPENRKMRFRIGVNLGDIIEEGKRIYGDGVNIAARLEALADPGGVCLSKTAFEHIESKLPFGYEYIGKKTVKNITKPVGAYRVLMEPKVSGVADEEEEVADMAKRRKPFLVGAIVFLFVIIGFGAWYFYPRSSPSAVEPASKERMAFPLPEKPSIAVLPFVNMSDDPNQAFFGDGITDQIITYLSMNPNIFVIARNSVFTYKGKPVKIQQVAEELGVRYVLEGSVQSVENRLRLTAQLIDALTGKHLWAERYDRELKDIFDLQDEITARILEELQVKLVFGEEYRRFAGSKNLNYIQKTSKGWSYFLLFTPESNAQARKMYEEAITLEPEAARAYSMLGWTHLFDVFFGVSKSPGKDMEKAFELAQKAITLNDSVGSPHSLLSYIYLTNRQYGKAVSEVELAVTLSPNDADARAHMAKIFNFVGKRKEAINLSKQAIRLNPFPQSYYFTFLGEALCLAGQHEEAIKAYKKALHLNPKDSDSKVGLAVAYSLLGREKDARAMAAEFLMIRPRFSVKRWEMGVPYKNRADVTLLADTMRKVGLPE